MDPDAALERIRELVVEAQKQEECDAVAVLDELAELVDGLDDWLTAGGFVPQQWKSARRRVWQGSPGMLSPLLRRRFGGAL